MRNGKFFDDARYGNNLNVSGGNQYTNYIGHEYRMELLKKKKMELVIDSFCSELPNEIYLLLKYARNLKCFEKPDYHYLKGLFYSAYKNYRIALSIENNKFHYDWVIKGVIIASSMFQSTKKIEGLSKSSTMRKCWGYFILSFFHLIISNK